MALISNCCGAPRIDYLESDICSDCKEHASFEEVEIDIHWGCSSWPNCDIDPNGCAHQGEGDTEHYGHKD